MLPLDPAIVEFLTAVETRYLERDRVFVESQNPNSPSEMKAAAQCNAEMNNNKRKLLARRRKLWEATIKKEWRGEL